jgi:hypothetical protein
MEENKQEYKSLMQSDSENDFDQNSNAFNVNQAHQRDQGYNFMVHNETAI